MSGVSPTLVFRGLTVLLSVTTTLYYFKTPADLKKKASLAGPLGPPNAEFDVRPRCARRSPSLAPPPSLPLPRRRRLMYVCLASPAMRQWCERNWLSHPLVAEPVNSASSLLYVLQPLIFLRLHRGVALPPELAFCLWAVGAIGLGSAAFHATLRYGMQLADELPMFALVLGASCALLRPAWGATAPRAAATALFGGLSAVLLTTERDGAGAAVHHVCRGVLSCTFSACFVFIFWRTAALARADDEALQAAAAKAKAKAKAEAAAPSSRRRRAAGPSPPSIFAATFAIWMATILCWIADILCCDALQSLPLRLPFPHLHGFWHLGSAVGLHGIFVLLLLHERLQQGAGGVRTAVCWGVVPYLTEEGSHSHDA